MSTNYKYIFIICILLIGNHLAYAQPDLESGEVEVIKNFKAKLLEAEKLSITPTLPALDTSAQRLYYSLPSRSLTVEYPAPTIRPLAMKAEELPPAYHAYAKLGYGTPMSPYIDLSYHRLFDEQLDVGLDLNHHSANNSNNLDNQLFNFTSGDLDVNYYLDNGMAVGANVGYQVDGHSFYGYDHTFETYDRDDVRQRFNTFDFGAKFFNGVRTQGDMNYSAELDYYNLQDYYASTENGTKLKLDFTKYINEKHPLGARLITDFTRFNGEVVQDLNNFKLQPYFGFHANKFKVDVGANVISHEDEFTIYPMIEATANVIGNKLTAFAGWRGDFKKNNFQTLSNYNPYIVSDGFELRNSEYQEFYGGIKGNIKIVDYHGQVSFKDVDNLALYLSNPADTKRFDVLYDSVQIVNISGTVDIHLIKNLTLGGTVSQSIFSMGNEDKPWHLPSFELNASAKYLMLDEKLTFKGEWYLANGVPYINDNDLSDNLGALFDLSFGAAYQINNNFGAFFDVNNLMANQRERWYRYPTFGLNILGGITLRF